MFPKSTIPVLVLVLCCLSTPPEASANRNLFRGLDGFYNETTTYRVGGRSAGETTSTSQISSQRGGALVVERSGVGQRGQAFTQREVFHPSGRYKITTQDSLDGRSVGRGRWQVKGRKLQFTISYPRGLSIKAMSVQPDARNFRTFLRYFQGRKLVATAVLDGQRAAD